VVTSVQSDGTAARLSCLMQLDDAEDIEQSPLLLADQLMAGLAREMRHIEYRQWVGAFQDKNSANWDGGKRLFCTQYGKWSVQSTQIESYFGHGLNRGRSARQFDT
jgi:hypothetical protein